MTGLPLEEIFRIAWPDLTPDLAQSYRTEYRSIYDREMVPATKLYEGARETLRAFHEAGLLQATVTGKRAADCERILRGLGIADEIDVYLGGDSVSRPKPAPDLAQHAMERLGVRRRRVRRRRRRECRHRDGQGRGRTHDPGPLGLRARAHRRRRQRRRHVGGSACDGLRARGPRQPHTSRRWCSRIVTSAPRSRRDASASTPSTQPASSPRASTSASIATSACSARAATRTSTSHVPSTTSPSWSRSPRTTSSSCIRASSSSARRESASVSPTTSCHASRGRALSAGSDC